MLPNLYTIKKEMVEHMREQKKAKATPRFNTAKYHKIELPIG